MQSENRSELQRLAVSMNEAARLAGVSRRSLENYAALKMLPTRKIGYRRLVLVRDLEKFLSSDRPSASPTAREARDGR